MATHKPAVIISGTAQDLPLGDGLKDIASLNVGVTGGIAVSSVATGDVFRALGTTVEVNSNGSNVSFIVQGDTATQLLTTLPSLNSVGIGTTTSSTIADF